MSNEDRVQTLMQVKPLRAFCLSICDQDSHILTLCIVIQNCLRPELTYLVCHLISPRPGLSVLRWLARVRAQDSGEGRLGQLIPDSGQ